MSNVTPRPWASIDHGAGEIVVYRPETEEAICTFDDTDGSWGWPKNYSTNGNAKDNAAHIVKCVNYHEQLIHALRWYEGNARLCRKITDSGEEARTALDRDGGELARSVLSELEQEPKQ
jgi:hypothetical protein